MSIADQITRLQGVKADIINAIKDKGVDVPDNESLSDAPNLISSISSSSGVDVTYAFTITAPSATQFIFKAYKCGSLLHMHIDTNYAYNPTTGWTNIARINQDAGFRFCYQFAQYAVGYYDNKVQPNDRLATYTNWVGANNQFSTTDIKLYAGSQVRYWLADITVIVEDT